MTVEDVRKNISLTPSEDGSTRMLRKEFVVVGDWTIQDRTDQWWSLHDGVVWSPYKDSLEEYLRLLKNGDPFSRGGPGQYCYSEEVIWAINRSPVGIVFISTDGKGIDLFSSDKEVT